MSDTFFRIILPLLVPLAAGAYLQRKFRLELGAFSKLLMYYYLPALGFLKMYEASLSASLLGLVLAFLLLQFAAVVLAGGVLTRLLRYPKPLAAAFSNSTALTNNGNIGIPVNASAFHQDPHALSIQMIVVTFELFATFTYGLFNVNRAASGLKKSLLQFARLPVPYALAAGALFRVAHVPVPGPLLAPVATVSDGMLSFALFTIGAQLVSTPLRQNTSAVLLSSLVRLAGAPLFAWGLLHLLGIHGITAQALLIASAIPTSRNSAALALEYGSEPGFAAQAVLLSTLLSSLTLTVAVQSARTLFPV